MKDRELALELGIGGFLLLLLLGMGILIVSWAAGGAQRGARHAEGPPERGSVPDERHQHISEVSPR
jgi:hypothetical protein